MKKTIFPLLLILLAGCTRGSVQYSDDTYWSKPSATDTAKADVFYITSTDVFEKRDTSGDSVMRILLDDSDRQALKAEMEYVRDMFGDRFNFFSPYYHQVTLEALYGAENERNNAIQASTAEVNEAFEYYMENLNGGRPFVLAGFSQGAWIALDILKRMSGEQYASMSAAYLIGYRLTEEDLANPRVIAAKGASERGCTVSFNTVSDTSGFFPMTTEGAVTCINPVNWHTDTTSAAFTFEGDTLTVSVDTVKKVLVVKGFEPDTSTMIYKSFPKGCLHHWDLLFYRDALRENAIERTYNFSNK